MARRRTGRTGRTARWIDWSPEMAAQFRIASAGGWTPPAQVRLTGGQYRLTLSAKFLDAAGQELIAKLRLARDCAGGCLYVVGEELQLPTLILAPRVEA